MSGHRLGILSLAAAVCIMLPQTSQATLFTGSSGSLSASADFSVVNGNLQVLLTNTSNADVLVPSDVLTAVFFNIASDPVFTSISAVLPQGSTVVYNKRVIAGPANGVVGGEWGYAHGLSGTPGGANQGISSSGLGGTFGQPTFPGSNLAGPAALDGLQYGILSAGDNIRTGNGGIKGNELVKNSVLFTLGAVPMNFDPAAFITDVSFQYGTNLSEPNYTASCTSACGPTGGGGNNTTVPEPASLLLLGTAGALLMGFTMRRRRRA